VVLPDSQQYLTKIAFSRSGGVLLGITDFGVSALWNAGTGRYLSDVASTSNGGTAATSDLFAYVAVSGDRRRCLLPADGFYEWQLELFAAEDGLLSPSSTSRKTPSDARRYGTENIVWADQRGLPVSPTAHHLKIGENQMRALLKQVRPPARAARPPQ
jgi:hypothetical protein